jgi:hypothetical protein
MGWHRSSPFVLDTETMFTLCYMQSGEILTGPLFNTAAQRSETAPWIFIAAVVGTLLHRVKENSQPQGTE